MFTIRKELYMTSAIKKIDISSLKQGIEVIEQEMQGLKALAGSLDDNFSNAVERILECRGRLVISGIGKSGHVARKIVATLSSTGTPSIFVHASEASHGDLGMITEDDVVMLLSNSGESEELSNIIDYCKRFSIPIIGVARNKNSTLIKASDIALVMPDTPEASNISAPTTSTTMMIALGDALAVVLHEKKGFTKSNFKIYHPGGKIGAKLLRVDDLMHKGNELPIVTENTLAIDALLEMTNKRLGSVGIVNEKGELSGIFTDGDLRRHIDANLQKTLVKDVMTANPVTITKDAFASEALCLMNKKSITVLMVVDGKKPIGAIQMHDILRAKVA